MPESVASDPLPAMKLLYTSDDRLRVANARNLVENAGIDTVLKNEYAAGGVGDLSPLDAWLELWVVDDADYDRAMQIIDSAMADEDASPWICARCGEENDASFEYCWNCQNERP